MVVHHAAKKASVPHREYIYRKKENTISLIHSFMLPSQIAIIFILQMPLTFLTPHTKFEQDCMTHEYKPSKLGLILHYFLSLSKRLGGLYSSFHTLYKNHYKIQMSASLFLSFGTLKNILWQNHVPSLVQM